MIKHFLIGFCRIIVGTLFIFSGLIKANDPLGFSYKLEEYWVEFGMNWEWLISLGVSMASFICILEIVLGVAILLAYRVKIVAGLNKECKTQSKFKWVPFWITHNSSALVDSYDSPTYYLKKLIKNRTKVAAIKETTEILTEKQFIIEEIGRAHV